MESFQRLSFRSLMLRVKEMDSLIQWFTTFENAVAFLVTVGVAVLFVCCAECLTNPSRDKDDLFHRHAL